MGTRARVNVIDGNQTLVSIYRQMDGYPDSLGKELADFAGPMTIVNGYSMDQHAPEYANGMGCLAAQLIAHLKLNSDYVKHGGVIGNVYIRDTSDESHGEEYVYNLTERDGKVHMTILEGGMTAFGIPGDSEAEMKVLYSGLASEFDSEVL
jgi:hypothetical protein